MKEVYAMKKWRIYLLGALFIVLGMSFTQMIVADETIVAMYRMYNQNTGEHFYTKNPYERAQLAEIGWKYEGIGWFAPSNSQSPVYRLYSPESGDHHYTMNNGERKYLINLGWRDEGIGWYSATAKQVPMYRSYNPNAQAGSHHYTANQNEQANLLKNGWRDEGIGWYAVKNGYASTIPALQYPHPLKFQFDGEKIAKHVFELVNALRQYNHLEPLVWNKEAKKVSDFRVWETMLLFDHTRPDGRKWDSVADDLHLKLPDYNGENIAATGLHHQSNEELADEFFDMWLHSMGHFLNMVKPDYREFATSYAYANGWVYGVQNFY